MSNILGLNTSLLKEFISENGMEEFYNKLEVAHNNLTDKKGKGNDFLGWVDLPIKISEDELNKIKDTAQKIRRNCNTLIVIGIGGSYLGARAGLEFTKSIFFNDSDDMKIYFAGQNISGSYINNIIKKCKDREVALCVISKSGTTTESSIAFRVFKNMLVEMYGKSNIRDRIVAVTDEKKGVLLELCKKEGYETFVVPSDVGGRFSVLTAVGLLPLAIAGCDVESIINGAKMAYNDFSELNLDNICYQYAVIRNILLSQGKQIEMLVNYDPDLKEFSEWFKQLFAESEGKDGKGIFPTSVLNSTDLHSLGQFVQDGNKIIFETVIYVENQNEDLVLPYLDGDFDGLNYIANKKLSDINERAMKGTILAHLDGNVPNIIINIKDKSENSFGYLSYFFMKACGISGHILGINPFNQGGVEDYKRNMFALLGKDGYLNEKEKLEKKLLEYNL